MVVGPRSQAAGLVSRRSELRALRRHIRELDEKLTAAQQRIREQQQQVADGETSVQYSMEKHTEIASALSDQRLMSQAISDRLESATSQLASATEEADKQQQRVEDAVRAKREMGEEAQQVTATLAEFDQRSEQIKQRLAQVEQSRRQTAKHVTTAQVSVARCEQRLEACQEQLQQVEQELSGRAQDRRRLLDELQRNQQKLNESMRQRLAVTSELAMMHLDKQSLQDQVRTFGAELEQLKSGTGNQRDRLSQCRTRLKEADAEKHQVELEVGRIEMERGTILERLRDDYGIEVDRLEQSDDWEFDVPREEMEEEIKTLKRKLNSIGAVNLDAVTELEDLERRFGSLNEQYHDLVSAKETLERIIDRINKDSRRLFAETLEQIRQNFQTLYRRSFGGGKADLVLEEGVDILESGIDIIATPPGKPEFNNSLLSGGERALTAVALLMAIFQYRPSPFCVLDEVDAPFDEANIGRFVEVLKGFLKWTRFVIVTHSKKTMTAANTLYGVTMQESGVSKQVSVRFEDVTEDGHILTPGSETQGVA